MPSLRCYSDTCFLPAVSPVRNHQLRTSSLPQMRPLFAIVAGLFAIASVGCGQSAEDDTAATTSAYTAEDGRTIKALSAERVAGLLAGDGLGYAMAAELNGYPGPRHALDLADSLTLTRAQVEKVEAVFQGMRSEAVAAGGELVRVERRLDSLFASTTASEEAVRVLTEEAGRVEARVRSAHLTAHVRTAEILTAEQIQEYDRLRGYGLRKPIENHLSVPRSDPHRDSSHIHHH